jgi:hypothetical protein
MGLLPGYRAVTTTVGGVTSGYCATGRVNAAIPPTITVAIESTAAKIGLRMKKSAMFIIVGSIFFPRWA